MVAIMLIEHQIVVIILCFGLTGILLCQQFRGTLLLLDETALGWRFERIRPFGDSVSSRQIKLLRGSTFLARFAILACRSLQGVGTFVLQFVQSPRSVHKDFCFGQRAQQTANFLLRLPMLAIARGVGFVGAIWKNGVEIAARFKLMCHHVSSLEQPIVFRPDDKGGQLVEETRKSGSSERDSPS